MNAFYFFGVTEFQDMLTPLLELLGRGEKCWVCFFDCLKSKRQLYYYNEAELFSFIENVCKSNNLPIPKLSFFGLDDRAKFEKEYDELKPKLVFVQSVFHKYPLWVPTAHLSKVVHFLWGAHDGLWNLGQTKYKNIVLNVLRHEEDVLRFNNHRERLRQTNHPLAPVLPDNFRYFGNFWIEQYTYNFLIPSDIFARVGNKRFCFIPETWLRTDDTRWDKNNVKLVDDVIELLHSHDYYVVVKKREKGYPVDSVNGFLNYITKQPDVIIDKDLYLPSSLFYLPLYADLCLLIGHKTQGTHALYDFYRKFNKNTMMCHDHDLAFQEISSFVTNAINDIQLSRVLPQERPAKLLIDCVLEE